MSSFVVKVAQIVRIKGKYYAFDREAASLYDYWWRNKLGVESITLIRTTPSLKDTDTVNCQEIEAALSRQHTVRQYEPLKEREKLRYKLPC